MLLLSETLDELLFLRHINFVGTGYRKTRPTQKPSETKAVENRGRKLQIKFRLGTNILSLTSLC